MSIDQTVIACMGIFFASVGMMMRQRRMEQWLSFYLGGMTLVAMTILMLVFRLSDH